uniref:WGS project CBMI000000000 data, contig CS3069_c001517 n=1 Tax=Fusarium clavum TaxID=2594811 RepID=A0A090MBT4_9HYPO|nr:unnamed protein product [Fusarium clavum]
MSLQWRVSGGLIVWWACVCSLVSVSGKVKLEILVSIRGNTSLNDVIDEGATWSNVVAGKVGRAIAMSAAERDIGRGTCSIEFKTSRGGFGCIQKQIV